MALTKAQKRLLSEIEKISDLIAADHWNIEEYSTESRTTYLEIMKQRLIRGEVILKYALVDEFLTNVICHYYFEVGKEKVLSYEKLWRTKRFQVFVHYLMDESFLLPKMRAVHAIKQLPKDVRDSIERINALRNALAHSLFPENRRQYVKHKKVMYRDADIFTFDGISKFEEDFRIASDYLWKRLYGSR